MGILGGSSVASALVGLLTLALSVLASSPAAPAPAGRTIEECDAQVREAPHSMGSYECYGLATRYGHLAEAISRLEGILQVHPDRYHAMTTLGLMIGSERGETLLREAAELAATHEDRAAEALARSRLAKQLDVRGESDEAAAQFEQAAQAARSAGDPVVLASILNRMGFHAYRQDDYGRALRLFRESDSIGNNVELPEGVRVSTMKGLGGISTRLGRYDEAMEYYGRQAGMCVEMGDRAAEASARYNLALAAKKLADRREIGVAQVEQRILEALDATIEAKSRRLEGMSRLLLGRYRSGAEALEQFERALELLRHSGSLYNELWAMREVAREKIRSGPGQQQDEGFRILDEAVEIARRSGGPRDLVRSYIARAFRAFAAQLPRAEWIGGYLRALDAVESLRDLQPEGNVRAQAFAPWIHPYYSLSGFLLDGLVRSPSPQEDMELAFHTMERMRSRQLLDTLDASGAGSIVAEAHPLHAERERVLQSISRTQKELMNRSLPEERRTEALVELENHEAAEADLRDRLAREDRGFADLRAPQIPSLEEVREALGPGQAMLLYQLWNRPPPKDLEGIVGTSWLLVVTSGDVDVLPLPEKQLLEKQIEVYEGLFENRDSSEAQGSVRFYEDLIAAAVDRLPDSIDHLIIVPDSILYRFPFAALRADAAGQPLATRYTITYVPSATLWMRWKRRDSALIAGALSLADPEPSSEELASKVRSAAPWIDGLDLGPLPHGRREAEAVVRSLGGVIRVGQEASEHFLKTTDLSSFGLVHFAAHAVLDQQSPERSAILLAPGSDKEDGLLQAREIVALDLDECVVVLSACRSASGELLEGEGVVGLAHAFFQAGARAVIGSLWPIRDSEAADLVEHLSANLARGESVSKSLGAAQRALIEDGAPTAAWAGLVVLGDGDSVSVRTDPNRVSTRTIVAVAALLTAVTGLVGWRILAYRRRLRSRDGEA